MKIHKINFERNNQITLSAKIWEPEGEAKALIQITHGMTEHIGRYETLANVLTKHGILLAGFDLRGHGENERNSSCASLGENGWEESLYDIHQFYSLLQLKHPGIPHFMLGFSLGSFLLREYLNLYPDRIAGAIIMGTGQQPSAILSSIMMIVNTQIKKVGFDQTTPLIQKLSFDTYNQKFSPVKTPVDWLCSDNEQLQIYRTDLLNKESISSGLFWQLLDSMKRTSKQTAYSNIKNEIPILLISGKEDPVGDFGKGVLAVEKSMKQAGLQNIELYLIPGARHDLLHEERTGAASQARNIIIDWIYKQI